MTAYYLLLRISFNARRYRGIDWLNNRNRDCALLTRRIEQLRLANLT